MRIGLHALKKAIEKPQAGNETLAEVAEGGFVDATKALRRNERMLGANEMLRMDEMLGPDRMLGAYCEGLESDKGGGERKGNGCYHCFDGQMIIDICKAWTACHSKSAAQIAIENDTLAEGALAEEIHRDEFHLVQDHNMKPREGLWLVSRVLW